MSIQTPNNKTAPARQKRPRLEGPISLTQLNALVRKHTAFMTMDDMLTAKGGYFPSLYVFRPEVKIIADAYDAMQAARGDNRRAYRHTK